MLFRSVGRNKDENEIIKSLALDGDILLEAKDHVGPVTLIRGENAQDHVEFGAAITLRYGDAPKGTPSVVMVQKNDVKSEVLAVPTVESAYIQYRI